MQRKNGRILYVSVPFRGIKNRKGLDDKFCYLFLEGAVSVPFRGIKNRKVGRASETLHF